MQVIPTINEKSFEEIKKKVVLMENIVNWIQFDIADGKFTSYTTWNNPSDLLTLNPSLNFEIHLMVAEPEKAVEEWFKIPNVKRVIVHLETINENSFNQILALAKNYQKEIGLAIESKTPWENIIPYANKIDLVQVLAVSAGPAGQVFEPSNLEKIKNIKKNFPYLKIAVDGGVNDKTAPLIKKAGADIINSSSYIFSDLSKVEEKIKLLEKI